MKEFLTMMKGFWLLVILYSVAYYIGTWVVLGLPGAPSVGPLEQYYVYPMLGFLASAVLACLCFLMYVLGDFINDLTRKRGGKF